MGDSPQPPSSPPPPSSEEELQTWPVIAGSLGVSVRQAQIWEKEQGLPVYRMPGPRTRVMAYASELRAWRAQRLATEAETESLPAAEQPRRRWPWLVAGAVLVVAAAWAIGWAWLARGEITRYTTQGRVLTAYDETNRVLWRHTFAMPIADHFRDASVLADLDQDGHLEMVFTYFSPGLVSTITYCFDRDGNVRWSWEGGREVRTPLGRVYSKPFIANSVAALSRPAANGGQVLIGNHHGWGWPYQVALLDRQGRLVAEYWHPGWIFHLSTADLDRDGQDEVLLAGVNNSYEEMTEDGLGYGSALVVLDPLRMNGNGPMRPGDDREVSGLARAQERAVLLVRAFESRPNPTDYYAAVVFRLESPGRIIAAVQGMATQELSHLEFDTHLRLRHIQPGLCIAAKLKSELPGAWTPGEFSALVQKRLGGSHIRYLVNEFDR